MTCKNPEISRKSMEIMGIPGNLPGNPIFPKNPFENRGRTVGIAPITLKHISWHGIRQSGQGRVRDLHGCHARGLSAPSAGQPGQPGQEIKDGGGGGPEPPGLGGQSDPSRPGGQSNPSRPGGR